MTGILLLILCGHFPLLGDLVIFFGLCRLGVSMVGLGA
jgi:hypothetical protein